MSAISSKLLFSVVMRRNSSKANVCKRKLRFKNKYANKAKHIKKTQMWVRKSYNSPLGYFELIFRRLSFISPCGCAVVDPVLFHRFIPCYLEGILPANMLITIFSVSFSPVSRDNFPGNQTYFTWTIESLYSFISVNCIKEFLMIQLIDLRSLTKFSTILQPTRLILHILVWQLTVFGAAAAQPHWSTEQNLQIPKHTHG